MIDYLSLFRRFARLPPGYVINQVKLHLLIDDPRRMLTRHSISVKLTNRTSSVIERTPNYIVTDLPKSIEEMRIKATDEDGNTLKLTHLPIRNSNAVRRNARYNFDYDSDLFFKYFEIEFTNPIPKGNSISYTYEYVAEEPERFFSFYYPADQLDVTIEYPRKSQNILNPFAFDGDAYLGEGRKVSWKQFKVQRTKKGRNIARYRYTVLVDQAYTFRW